MTETTVKLHGLGEGEVSIRQMRDYYLSLCMRQNSMNEKELRDALTQAIGQIGLLLQQIENGSDRP